MANGSNKPKDLQGTLDCSKASVCSFKAALQHPISGPRPSKVTFNFEWRRVSELFGFWLTLGEERSSWRQHLAGAVRQG
jgi:hypothetical protein